jgi:membrane protein YdbS with pleckstrin-like domain
LEREERGKLGHKGKYLAAPEITLYERSDITMNEPALTTPEKFLWTGTVSHLHYAGKWLLVLLLLGAACGSFWLVFPEYASILWAARAALLLLAVLLIGWIQIDRRRRRYAVTNKRVSVEYGIISRTSNEVRIQDIRSINLTKKGFSGLLGIGRVEFSSAATDDADVIFWNTPEAEKVRDLVRSLQT